jgi:hypothetical protein
MADEIELHWTVSGSAEQAVAKWRADPPSALAGRYELEDESYNGLTYQRTHYDWPAKLLFVIPVTLPFALLLRTGLQSVFRFTVRFDADGRAATRITLTGTADPRTAAALRELSSQTTTAAIA